MNDADAPCVVLFASADLVGSTAYKNRTPIQTEKGARKQEWYKAFANFYSAFYSSLNNKLKRNKKISEEHRKFLFLKALGDELIFYQYLANHSEAIELVRYFRNALREFNSELKDELNLPLGVKGAMWIAGFPINNAQIETPPPHQTSPDDNEKGVDFLGPSIDTGFRITKFADRRRLVVGVDLALLLTANKRKVKDLIFYFDGLHQLKGVLNEKPYPIIWVACEDESPEERLIGIEKKACGTKPLHDYCQKYIEKSASSWLIKPYFSDGGDPLFNDQPEAHRRMQEENRREDIKSREINNDDDSVSSISANKMLQQSIGFMPELNNPKSKN